MNMSYIEIENQCKTKTNTPMAFTCFYLMVLKKNNMSNYLFLSNYAYSVWKRYITIALLLQYNTTKLSDLVGIRCLFFTFVSFN